MADASTVNEVAATFISHFDVLEEPSTESFLAVAEATSAYTDSASSLHWNEGDVFFLRKELDNNAWLASFRGEEGEIPSEKFKVFFFFFFSFVCLFRLLALIQPFFSGFLLMHSI